MLSIEYNAEEEVEENLSESMQSNGARTRRKLHHCTSNPQRSGAASKARRQHPEKETEWGIEWERLRLQLQLHIQVIM